MNTTDFLSLRDFPPEKIRELLDLAADMKSSPKTYADSLHRKTLAMIFEKPSLRTRVTFDVGIQQLGGFSLYLSPAEINLGKRESVYDVAKNLERMVQAIMIRTFAHDIVERMAACAAIPVINGLTDFSHPCQAMADYLTIEEVKGRIAGLKIAFFGDGNNVCHSLIFGGAQLGADLWVATPSGYEPRAEAVDWACRRAAQTGATLTLTGDPVQAATGADVLYTDVWASMGQESEAAQRERIFRPYQVNSRLLAHAKRDAVFMHCLPAHRGDEVTSQVMDSPCSVVFRQAENRLHVQKAILFELMKGEVILRPRRVRQEEAVHL